jgi:hypothetical protein
MLAPDSEEELAAIQRVIEDELSHNIVVLSVRSNLDKFGKLR